MLATVMAALGAVMVLATIPVWTRSGWNLPRRIHFSLFALAYGVLAWSFFNWGLVGFGI
jgi:hypothetical protein